MIERKGDIPDLDFAQAVGRAPIGKAVVGQMIAAHPDRPARWRTRGRRWLGDAYYLDVTYPDGTGTRFTIDARDDRAAYYETAYILGGCGDVYVPPERRNPTGVLRLADGAAVASGGTAHFEGLSWPS